MTKTIIKMTKILIIKIVTITIKIMELNNDTKSSKKDDKNNGNKDDKRMVIKTKKKWK